MTPKELLTELLQAAGIDDPTPYLTADACNMVESVMVDRWNEGFAEGQAQARCYGYAEMP